RLPAAGLAAEDEVSAFGDELRSEIGTERLAAEARLKHEVELLVTLQEWEVRVTHRLGDARLVAVRDLLRHEDGDEVAVAHALLGCADLELGQQASDGGQVQPLEQRVD